MEPKPNGFIAKPLPLPAVSEDTPSRVPRKKTQESPTSEVSGPSKSVMDTFRPFIHDGSVSLSSDMSDYIQIKLLRDSGASQPSLLSDTLAFSEKSSFAANILIG